MAAKMAEQMVPELKYSFHWLQTTWEQMLVYVFQQIAIWWRTMKLNSSHVKKFEKTAKSAAKIVLMSFWLIQHNVL